MAASKTFYTLGIGSADDITREWLGFDERGFDERDWLGCDDSVHHHHPVMIVVVAVRFFLAVLRDKILPTNPSSRIASSVVKDSSNTERTGCF